MYQRSPIIVWAVLIISFFMAVGVRIASNDLTLTPDSWRYLRLAENLELNFCYSLSAPDTAECEPSWGGQPPGYPFLLILFKKINADLNIVMIMQSVIFGVAITAAMWAAYAWNKSISGLFVLAIFLVFSPLSVAWPSWVLTETLTAASSLWLFTLLIHSIRYSRVLWLQIGAAIALSILLRWDQFFLLAPALCIVIYIDGLKKCNKKFLYIFSIASVPIVIMVTRAVFVGLPLLPAPIVEPAPPDGVVEFFRAAALNEKMTQGFIWPIWVNHYEGIEKNFDYNAVHPKFRTKKFQTVLKNIEKLPNGTPLPKALNEELAELAELPSAQSFVYVAHLSLQRMIAMWTQRNHVHRSGWTGDGVLSTLGEPIAHIYKVSLLVIVIILLVFARGESLVLLFSLVAYLLSRSVLLAVLTALEIRYLAPVFPAMELVIVASGFKMLREAGSRNR